jgi:hypothetical protein
MESADQAALLASLKVGEKVDVLYARSGQMFSTSIEVKPEPGKSFRLDWMETVTPQQDMLRKKWLRLE